MKICIISNGYPDKENPQYGCFERDQALALKSFGHNVTLLYVDRRVRSANKICRRPRISVYSESGINIYGVVMFPFSILNHFGYIFHSYLNTRFLFWGFRKLMKKEGKPDIIYAHYMYNIAYASYLKRKTTIPLVGIEHWSVLTRDKLTSELMRMGHLAYDNCDKLLAVSDFLCQQIKKHFGNDSIVINDMVGGEFFKQSLSEEISVEDKKVHFKGKRAFLFLTVGSLKQIKGYDILLESFAKSKLAEKGCRIVMIGDGEEKQKLEKQIKELGITDFVNLVGSKKKNEIIGWMSICHVFVLSSRNETFSVACVEALSQGLPCIATMCGGPQEIITEKNGILVPKQNVEALAEAMKQMYSNYLRYNKSEIADNCAKLYAPQVITAKLTKIFEDTILHYKND